jgi:PST family polysaccharide transporter
MDNILIGRYVSDVALGFYSQAYRLLLMPVQQVNAPVSSVVIPALSRLQDQPERFARFYYLALGAVTFLGMPIIGFLLVDARSVILIVLGRQWLPVVTIFQALGIAAFVGTFGVAGGWVYSSLGRTAQQLRQQLVVCPVTILAFFLGLPWGALGVAVSFSTTRLLLAWPTLAWCYRGTPIDMRSTATTLARPASAAIGAGVTLWAVQRVAAQGGSVAWILLDALIYGVTYMAIWYVVPGGRRHLKQLLTLLDELKPKRNRGARDESAPDLDTAAAASQRQDAAAAVPAPQRPGLPATGDRRR